MPEKGPSFLTSTVSPLTLPFGMDVPLHLWSAPRVMAIINITPDSFSDGGRYLKAEAALARAAAAEAEGAHFLDLGAESTRPGGGVYGDGAREVGVQEEIDRLIPVLEILVGQTQLPISVDTRKAPVAAAALKAGAHLINDVGGLDNPEMRAVVARAGCPVVLMHSRGALSTMQNHASFKDVRREVASDLNDRVQIALNDGVSPHQIILDPGLGFGKAGVQNFALLADLSPLHRLGFPVLVGASRKSFLGEITGQGAADRLAGSLATVAWAAKQKASILRVHDVGPTIRFLKVWQAMAEAAP